MVLEIKPIESDEIKYTYQNSKQIDAEVGKIGELRGDFSSTGNEFYTSWQDDCFYLKTDEFNDVLDNVINELRSDKYGLLKDRNSMQRFVDENQKGKFNSQFMTEYGYKVETEKHTFLIRCNPLPSVYNFYVDCFYKQYFNEHLRQARKGIRFVDSHYKELFRIPDGAEIKISFGSGTEEIKRCRFIDNYHTLIGNNIFHICEFADVMDLNKGKFEPKDKSVVIKKSKEKDLER